MSDEPMDEVLSDEVRQLSRLSRSLQRLSAELVEDLAVSRTPRVNVVARVRDMRDLVDDVVLALRERSRVGSRGRPTRTARHLRWAQDLLAVSQWAEYLAARQVQHARPGATWKEIATALGTSERTATRRWGDEPQPPALLRSAPRRVDDPSG